jgi:hypothetical protein
MMVSRLEIQREISLILSAWFFAQAGKHKHGMAVGWDRLLVENLVRHEKGRVGGY